MRMHENAGMGSSWGAGWTVYRRMTKISQWLLSCLPIAITYQPHNIVNTPRTRNMEEGCSYSTRVICWLATSSLLNSYCTSPLHISNMRHIHNVIRLISAVSASTYYGGEHQSWHWYTIEWQCLARVVLPWTPSPNNTQDKQDWDKMDNSFNEQKACRVPNCPAT